MQNFWGPPTKKQKSKSAARLGSRQLRKSDNDLLVGFLSFYISLRARPASTPHGQSLDFRESDAPNGPIQATTAHSDGGVRTSAGPIEQKVQLPCLPLLRSRGLEIR
jgi:hypothetical protein